MASIGLRTLTSISVALTALFIGGGVLAQSDLRRVDGGEVLVVTFNYRVGIFGFLAHPETKQTRTISGRPLRLNVR